MCLWELFSLGKIPYSEMSNEQVVQHVNSGNRLSCPVNCPSELYSVMLSCWNADPNSRPTFTQLYETLHKFYIRPPANNYKKEISPSTNPNTARNTPTNLYVMPTQHPSTNQYQTRNPATNQYQLQTSTHPNTVRNTPTNLSLPARNAPNQHQGRNSSNQAIYHK